MAVTARASGRTLFLTLRHLQKGTNTISRCMPIQTKSAIQLQGQRKVLRITILQR